jgi:hypothetical protein
LNSVQIARDFFRVVVWFDARRKLRATCYVLTQGCYPGAIGTQRLDLDRIMIDSHVPIGEIARRTGLKFHANIVENDTTKPRRR